MQASLDTAHGTPRDSATVVLLRDGADGPEVFLLKRSGLSDAFGEAYVFPGGKLDANDSSDAALQMLDTPADALVQALGEPELPPAIAAGLYVAAARELLEEAGVRLPVSSLVPWSRWITPKMAAMSKKRFDTRFFLTLAPSDQTARHDDYETTASIWLTPQEALLRYDRGEISMAPPQIMSLGHLARYASAQDALQAARRQLPPCICPEHFMENEETVLCYPGDPNHSVAQRALPGPTRLYVRDKKFVAANGLQSLWGDDA